MVRLTKRSVYRKLNNGIESLRHPPDEMRQTLLFDVAAILHVDSNPKEGDWTIDWVIESLPGRDGLLRIVRIRTDKGEFRRPTNRLCLDRRFLDRPKLRRTEHSCGVPPCRAVRGSFLFDYRYRETINVKIEEIIAVAVMR